MGNDLSTGTPVGIKRPVQAAASEKTLPKKENTPPGLPRFVVAVVDDFRTPYLDLDGDGKPDQPHGQVVSYHVRDENPFAQTVPFDINNNPELIRKKATEPDYKKRIQLNGQFYDDTFQAVAKRMNKGEQTDGVVMSLLPTLFSEDGKDEIITLKHLTQLMGEPITAENIGPKKDAIREKLTVLSKRLGEKDLSTLDYQYGTIGKQLLALEENITENPKKSVPVYLSPGNTPDTVNLLGFAKGTRLIGSVDAKGNPVMTSPTYSLIHGTAQGHFSVMPVADAAGNTVGYDINGDGKHDIPAHLLSRQGKSISPWVSNFAGKKLEEVLANPEDWQEVARLLNAKKDVPLASVNGKLIPYRPFLEAVKRDEKDIQARLQSKGDYLTFPPTLFFRLDTDGRVYYDPDNSGRKGAVWEHSGTSFSAPRAMGRDLLKTFQQP